MIRYIYNKILNKVVIERSFLYIVKATYHKSTADIILSGYTIKVFPLRPDKFKSVCPLSTPLFKIVLEVLVKAN